MFKRLLEKLSGSPKTPSATRPKTAAGKPQLPPYQEAFFQQIREKSASDPLIGAKLGGKEIFQRVLTALRNEKGVHTETLLAVLGALAGYACQAQLRAEAFKNGKPESSLFQVMTTANGKSYYFGDPLNHLLAGPQYSVWSLAGGGAAHLGVTAFPDPHELFKYVVATIGESGFGMPRLPAGHGIAVKPLDALKSLWPSLFPTIKLFCPDPAHWPILYSLAAQEAIIAAKGVIAPELAFAIVMESAIPMSKVDLANA